MSPWIINTNLTFIQKAHKVSIYILHTYIYIYIHIYIVCIDYRFNICNIYV